MVNAAEMPNSILRLSWASPEFNTDSPHIEHAYIGRNALGFADLCAAARLVNGEAICQSHLGHFLRWRFDLGWQFDLGHVQLLRPYCWNKDQLYEACREYTGRHGCNLLSVLQKLSLWMSVGQEGGSQLPAFQQVLSLSPRISQLPPRKDNPRDSAPSPFDAFSGRFCCKRVWCERWALILKPLGPRR